MPKNRSSVVFLFPHTTTDTERMVAEGTAPSERLYGLEELRAAGWEVAVSDARWEDGLRGLRRAFRRFFELPSLSTFQDMRAADVVLVKDDFSVTLLLQARALKRPIVYLDAMFDPPKRFWRRWGAAINLRFADAVLCYSDQQAQVWAQLFRVPKSRFTLVRYCLDTDFYPNLMRNVSNPPFVLAVGRDIGRDFETLLSACEQLQLHLKLVTLPYLLPVRAVDHPLVEVRQHVSYQELFDLYARTAAAVVPLRAGLTYPSGIRAALEAAVLGVPTVAADIPIMREYFDTDSLSLYAPENVQSLRVQLEQLINFPERAEALAQQTSEWARQRFQMPIFTQQLDHVLRATLEESRHDFCG